MIIEDGVLIRAFELNDNIPPQYRETAGTPEPDIIVVPDGVVHISADAFKGLNHVKQVILPESVEIIESRAFKECKSLEKINIPGKVKAIGDATFYQCQNLREISFPEGLKSIGKEAFLNCKSLEEIILPEGLEEILKEAFLNCKKISELKIPCTVKKMEMGAFTNCGGIKHIDFEKDENGRCGIFKISERTFEGCSSLEEIIVPEGVEVLEYCAFTENCKVKKIELPSTLIRINDKAFGTDSIGVIGIDTRIGENIFHMQMLHELKCIDVKTGDPDILISLSKICPRRGDLMVFLPSKEVVKQFKSDIAQKEGISEKDAKIIFDTSIIVTDSHRECEDKELEIVYSGSKPTQIPEASYALNDKIEELTTTGKIQKIGKFAFAECENLRSVIIGEGVEEIDDKAFSNCKKLEEVILPSTLKKLGESVFEQCESLKKITIQEGIPEIDVRCFWNCKSLQEIRIPEGVKVIGEEAFLGCEKLQFVTIPSTTQKLDFKAFGECKELIQIELPSKLKELAERVFDGCKKLTKVVAEGKLPQKFEQAFYGCDTIIEERGKKQSRIYEVKNGEIVSDSVSEKQSKPEDIVIREGERSTVYLAPIEPKFSLRGLWDSLTKRKKSSRKSATLKGIEEAVKESKKIDKGEK